MTARTFMSMVALAACHGAPARTLPVEVRSGAMPVAEAVVIATCTKTVSAGATDVRGRVVLAMTEADDAATCRVLAGRDGYRTLEVRPARICEAAPCAPWVLVLEELAR